MTDFDVNPGNPELSSTDPVTVDPPTSGDPIATLIEAVDRLEADALKMADPNDQTVTRLSSLTLMKRSIDLYDQALLLVMRAPYSDEAREQGERIAQLRDQFISNSSA